MGTKKSSYLPGFDTAKAAQRKAAKALCADWHAVVQHPDADEAPDPVEANGEGCTLRIAVAPTQCLGFACPERAEVCESRGCKIFAEALRDEASDEPVFYEPSRPKLFAPATLFGNPNDAKLYVRSAAPMCRGAMLFDILRRHMKSS